MTSQIAKVWAEVCNALRQRPANSGVIDMACKLGSRTYFNTVTCDGSTSTEPGAWNPVTELIPLADFDRVRAKIELLAYSPEASIKFCVRFTNDGVTFGDIYTLDTQAMPQDAAPYLYLGWIGMGDNFSTWAQFGFLARKYTGATPSASRPVANVRLTLAFNSGSNAAAPY